MARMTSRGVSSMRLDVSERGIEGLEAEPEAA
jgi:hypothetical protein